MVLTINNVQIKKLSGPVSFTMLRPISSLNEFPAIMLFGDAHFSSAHQCEDKDVSDKDIIDEKVPRTFDDVNKGVYKIYSSTFLKLLDSPYVDFYTEAWFDKNENDETYFDALRENNDQPINLIREEIAPCYYKELRGKQIYEKYCPTKHIRWHFVDPRYAYDTYEYYLSIIEMEFLPNLKNAIKKGKLENNFIEKTINKHFNRDQKLFIHCLKMIQLMLNYKDPETFFNMYYSEDNKYFIKKSLIYKQLKKQLNQFYFWKKKTLEYFNQYTEKIIEQNEFMILLKFVS